MKHFWQIFLKGCRQSALYLGCWAAMASAAWAQNADTNQDDGEGGTTAWVMAYALVVLGVALGMLVVYKSSGRRERAKPEAYSGSKDAQAKEERKKA